MFLPPTFENKKLGVDTIGHVEMVTPLPTWKQEWRSGESTCLPPAYMAQVCVPEVLTDMTEGRVRCWFSPFLQEVFSGYSGFPLSSNANIANYNSFEKWLMNNHFLNHFFY